MYGVTANGDDMANGSTACAEMDIEAAINQEVEGMKSAKRDGLFRPVRVDVACGKLTALWARRFSTLTWGAYPVLFFKTRPPIEPVAIVQRICLDAFQSSGTKNHRWIRRLTPMTRMGKATKKGLDEVSKVVLGPVFHGEGALAQKVFVYFPYCCNATAPRYARHSASDGMLLSS